MFCVALTVGLAGATSVRSDDVALNLDPSKATVAFKLGAFLHSVSGSFKLQDAVIRYNLETGAANGNVIIDLRTGESGDSARDDRMQKSVLETQTYPSAVFTPEHVTGQLASSRNSHLSVDGTLNIHGLTHPITVPLDIVSAGGTVSAHASFRVPYVAWGMKDPSTFILHVRNYVDVDVTGPVTISAPSNSPRAPGTQ
jgi:polyisoprenoid-binding protein YceI